MQFYYGRGVEQQVRGVLLVGGEGDTGYQAVCADTEEHAQSEIRRRRLKQLSLKNNKIEEIPTEIQELKTLNEIDLSENIISNVLRWVSRL